MNLKKLSLAVDEASEAIERLRTELEAAKEHRDPFAAYVYQARQSYRETREREGKSLKRLGG